MRRTSLKPSNARLRRSTPLRQAGHRIKQRRAPKPRLQASTAKLALHRFGGRCAGCIGEPQEYHHLLRKEKWPELADCAENVVPVCRRCHEKHELAFERLPQRVLVYLRKLDLTPAQQDYLERTYR